MTTLLPLSHSPKKRQKKIIMKFGWSRLGPLRADAIFSDLSREADKNLKTFAKKGRDMARSAVANKIVTPTVS